jgi:hypothetical protein
MYRVFAGPYSKLEDLAPDVARLRSAGFFPEIERQGEGFLLVVRRGVSRSVAEDCVSRVREQQLRVRFTRE